MNCSRFLHFSTAGVTKTQKNPFPLTFLGKDSERILTYVVFMYNRN